MAARETVAQKKARISLLLAEFDAASRESRKLAARVKTLKEQIKEIPSGTYGEWVRSEGTPREIQDNLAIKARFAALGEVLPTKMSEAPVIVTHVADKK